MKKIKLTQGKYALVDDADFEWLNQWKWTHGHNEAHRNAGGGKWIKMHRLIMDEPEGMVVDHKNNNRLDNRRDNLRICTQQQNTLNSPIRKSNKSGYKDIWWDKSREKWFVQIMCKGKKHTVGRFANIKEAIQARNSRIIELHGDFARTEQTNG